jgi:hypothetical protein
VEETDGAPAGAIRVGFPAARDLSPQTWVGERAAGLLPPLVERIRERCAPSKPLLVFLTGSATHGELCGLLTPGGGRRFLSDLDVGILTDERLSGPAQQRLLRAAAEVSTDAPEARLGFYCVADLGRQDPTLGLVEGVRCGIVLDGDPSNLGRFRVPAPADIPLSEGRRLLANRALEWLLAAGGAAESATDPVPADATRRCYAAGKLAADIAAVALLARGAYRGGGYRARAAAAGRLGLLDAETLSRVEAWTRWRLEPVWDAPPLGGPVDDPRAVPLLGRLVREMTLAGMYVCSGGPDIAAFVSALTPGPRARLRSWKRWIGSGAGKMLGLRPAHLVHGPRDRLWGAAIASALGRDGEAIRWLSLLENPHERGAGKCAERIVAIARWMDREGID